MGLRQEAPKEIWVQVGPEGTTLRMTPESFRAHLEAQASSAGLPHVTVDLGTREGTQLRVLPENLQGVVQDLQKKG